jgi:uncharacterized protein YbjT (DUF2867 family)
MHSLFLTGATGNVGRAVLDALVDLPGFGTQFRVTAGLRNPAEVPAEFAARGIGTQAFDFENPATFGPALQPGQAVFLLRPPQLSGTGPFEAFVAEAKRVGVGYLVFLSVQGVERSSVIPHHQIEKLIVGSGIPYGFLRPGYFMQNLTTTLRADLERNEIFLPAANALFNWVSVADIGRVAARVLTDPIAHHNARYDLTGPENRSFPEVVSRINRLLGRGLRYESPNLLRFFLRKRREGWPAGYILVVTLLHYLPRFQAKPPLSDAIERITGQPPTSVDEYIQTELRAFFGSVR